MSPYPLCRTPVHNLYGISLLNWQRGEGGVNGGCSIADGLPLAITLQDGKQSNSWWLKFEALCVYFSQTDGHTLLELPKTVPKVLPIPDEQMWACCLITFPNNL